MTAELYVAWAGWIVAAGLLVLIFVPWKRRRSFVVSGSAQHRQTVEELQQLEIQYRSFRDEAPVGIFHTKPSGGFLYVNAKAAKILGYSSAAELVDSISDVGSQLYVDPGVRAELYRKLISEGIVKNAEVRLRRADGDVIWMSLSLRAVRDVSGCLDHVEGFAVNVTERKVAEEARAASERMLRQMFVWMRDIVYRLDSNGRIVFINHAVSRYGYMEEELLGKHISDIVHPGDRETMQKRTAERRTGGRRTSEQVFHLMRKNGPDDITEAPIMQLEAEGVYEVDAAGRPDFVGTIGMVRDVTRKKRAEEELTRFIATRELLLRELQHRVKNNLQVIQSLISLNMSRTHDHEALRICREIRGYVGCMSTIHALLSRTETGDVLNLADMVRDVYDSAARTFDPKRIVPEFELENLFIHMDRALPCGMLLNELFTNTFKHAFPSSDSGQVDVKLSRLSDGRVCLVVSDNGVGFGDTGKCCGHGMGMGLVRLMASQLKADLERDDDAGVRTTLIFDPSIPCEHLKGRVVPGVEL